VYRWQAIIVSLLAACGGNGMEKQQEKPKEPVEVSIFHYNGTWGQVADDGSGVDASSLYYAWTGDGIAPAGMILRQFVGPKAAKPSETSCK
jgi:hypothetical protein